MQNAAMLIGSPRSGTTWLAKIVDSHPAVLYRHEPDSVVVRSDIPFVPESKEVPEYIRSARDYLGVLALERGSKSAGSQPLFAKSYRAPLSEHVRRLLVYALKGSERLAGRKIPVSRWQVPDLIDRARDVEPMLIMKSVSSLCRTYMYSLACPEMKFIHILRHPCGYVASTLRGNRLGFLNDDAYIETLAEMSQAVSYGLTLGSLQNLSREEQLAARWMLQNEKVMEEMSNNSNYKCVIYEELCNRPQEVVDELFSFLGLEMGEQTATFVSESSHGKETEPRYFEVKRDSGKAANSWVDELNQDQVGRIRQLVSGSMVGKLYFSD